MKLVNMDNSLAHELLAMPDVDFRDIVNRDLRKNSTPEEHAALRSPLVVDRWYSVLIATSKSVDGQLAASRQDYRAKRAAIDKALLSTKEQVQMDNLRIEELELEMEYAQSRGNKLRFKSGLDQWIIEAQQIRSGLHKKLQDRAAELEAAIKQHQRSFDPLDTPSDEDQRLWSKAADWN